MSKNNRRKAFADVVTIDAWHNAFNGAQARVDLHADVVFGTARLGGEVEAPVRFRLSVKRAEVVVIIPDSEPLSVDPTSVAREVPEQQGRLTEVFESATSANAKGNASVGFSSNGIKVATGGEVGVQGHISTNKKIEVSADVHFMTITSSKTADGDYRWIIQPSTTNTLDGRPWDATKQPRLMLIDRRNDRTKGIPPTVRVEVRCLREDLIIEDLEIKNEGAWEAAKRRVGFKNRFAAAVSYIRDRLVDEGLEARNIDDIFGQVTLASATAETV